MVSEIISVVTSLICWAIGYFTGLRCGDIRTRRQLETRLDRAEALFRQSEDFQQRAYRNLAESADLLRELEARRDELR